jgi:hypothetical protein
VTAVVSVALAAAIRVYIYDIIRNVRSCTVDDRHHNYFSL